MSISKVESGQMEVFIKETNINVQVEYIYTFFKPEAEQKGIKLFFKNAFTAQEANLETDREKVYAILTNLVKNALKFTQTGTIEFGYYLNEKEPAELEFFVKDTGMGIRLEQQEFIFDRFRQGSESLNRNYEGAGLGLSISKAYVEMLGGKIWVESEEGIGSTFYFTIPYRLGKLEKKANENIVLTDVATDQLKKLKILIVDDDEISLTLMKTVVTMFGKDILKARNGIQAVEVCRKNSDINLVLMDIKMPGMDGYEATRQIRQFNKEVIIIAQSAFALIGDKEKTIEAGCNDYLSKPINRVALTALMKKYSLIN